MRRTLAIFPICFFLLGFMVYTDLPAQQEKTTTKSNVASPVGTWTWERKADKKKLTTKLTISEKSGTYSGRVKDSKLDLKIEECKFEDGKLSFLVFPYPDRPKKSISFFGSVSDDQIKGKMSFDVDGETKSDKWLAKRFNPMNAAVGKWLVEFDTPDGQSHAYEFRAKIKDEKITLKFIGDQSAEVKNVKFKDGVLSFYSQQDYEGQNVSVDWELEIDGSNLGGKLYYSFDNSQEEGELEVTGSQVK